MLKMKSKIENKEDFLYWPDGEKRYRLCPNCHSDNLIFGCFYVERKGTVAGVQCVKCNTQYKFTEKIGSNEYIPGESLWNDGKFEQLTDSARLLIGQEVFRF